MKREFSFSVDIIGMVIIIVMSEDIIMSSQVFLFLDMLNLK